jgi:hypothetical protein
MKNILSSIFRVYEGHAKKGMARSTIVMDENLDGGLKEALKGANFRVISVRKGTLDQEIMETILGHRILITKNTKDFKDFAPVYDFGIVALEKLPFIDNAKEYAKNSTARMISNAISKHRLISLSTGFVLWLNPNGRHDLEVLE